MNNHYDRDLIPVEGNSTLKRDSYSSAIINTDKSAYEKYILLKDQKTKERKEIDSLKSELAEIRTMLAQLVDKL